MAKRCPPGVICIENITITIVLIIVACVVLFLNMYSRGAPAQQPIVREKVIVKENSGLFPRASYSFSNVASDVLLNPYQAPLKNDNVFPTTGDPRGIPINIPTQSVDSTYRQVGILTRNQSATEMILPLMGRPLFTNRDKWNYYTMTDKSAMIKLPITSKGRSCTNEYGCDSLYNGDTVFVEGYGDAFRVTMYDNQVMRYIPYL
jgi:hypothetical protein